LAARWGLWSNAGVFVRVWEYQAPDDPATAFTAAYAPDGAWGQLFARAAGFLGTELYYHAAQADRYLTIDRWRAEKDDRLAGGRARDYLALPRPAARPGEGRGCRHAPSWRALPGPRF
jgi:hypothetical protein